MSSAAKIQESLRILREEFGLEPIYAGAVQPRLLGFKDAKGRSVSRKRFIEVAQVLKARGLSLVGGKE